MSMNDYSNQRQPNKEPLTAKITRYVGVGSSLVIIGGLAYYAYGLGTRDASDVAVIKAQSGDIRTAPENAGGEEVDYQGNQVNGVLEGNPPSLTDQVELAPTPTNLDSVQPAATDGETSSNLADTEIIPTDGADNDQVVLNDKIASIPAPERRPELLYIPPKDQMNPATIEARRVGAEAGEALPVPVASASEIVENTKPLPSISTPSASPTDSASVDTPQETETAVSEDDLGPRLPSGTPLVQLAANVKLSDTQAQWKKFQASNPELLGNKKLYVEKKTINGKVWFRLRVSGFADGADAQATCASLAAQNVQCIYVRSE